LNLNLYIPNAPITTTNITIQEWSQVYKLVAYQIFIKNVRIELIIPAIMQVLVSDQISNIDVVELSRFSQSCWHGCLSCAWCTSHQNVWLLSLAIFLHHDYSTLTNEDIEQTFEDCCIMKWSVQFQTQTIFQKY
jgi:hypothetical protein